MLAINPIDDRLIHWLTINNPTDEPIELWLRQFGVDQAGVIYAPSWLSEQPIKETAEQAADDGIQPVFHLEHVYLPVDWMLARFPSELLRSNAGAMRRMAATAIETGATTATLMRWLTFPESGSGLETWQLTNGVAPDGTIYSAAAYADFESKIAAMAKEEGIRVEMQFGRAYAPTLWLATKNPARRDLLLSIEKRIREELEFIGPE